MTAKKSNPLIAELQVKEGLANDAPPEPRFVENRNTHEARITAIEAYLAHLSGTMGHIGIPEFNLPAEVSHDN